jgi:hypothetical protein
MSVDRSGQRFDKVALTVKLDTRLWVFVLSPSRLEFSLRISFRQFSALARLPGKNGC